jgi:DNA-binding beta-propeller fold protein YncE
MTRTSWIPLLLLCVASSVSATVFTEDGVIAVDETQVRTTSDGHHEGKAWEGTLTFPSPMTMENGDTLQGTVAFGSTLLRVRDGGGGFFQVGMTTGFEQLIAIATDPGSPVRSSQEANKAVFTDARGPSVEVGDSRLVFAAHNGVFMQVVENFVDAGNDIFVSGINYRLTLIIGGPFTFSDIDFRVLGEDLGVLARAPGDLAFRTCITGETESGPEESDACRIIDGVSPGGLYSGLGNIRAIAVSADGKSVYTASGSDDAIARFDRDVLTNVLTYRDCLSGDTAPGPDGSGACTEVPGAQAGGVHSGLDFPQGLAVSPDGKSVYVASVGDDAVTRFERDVDSGALTFGDCITGDLDADAQCLILPTAVATGADSGMDGLRAVVVSPDGKSAYAIATEDDAVIRFDRDLDTGALFSLGCISGETESDDCELIPSATSQGHDSGLDAPFGLALSADGTSLYVAARDDDAVARFTRDPDTGGLTYEGCISGESASDCTHVPSATTDGLDSGLDELYALAVSPDGASVYAVSERDDAVVRFTRDTDTGALGYEGCITGETESGAACTEIASATSTGASSGLDKARSVAVTPDGASVYVASPADDAMARFDRDRGTGALTYRGCLSAELETTVSACDRIGSASTSGTSSGVDNPQAFVLSPDGVAVYTTSGNDAAVSRFDREPFPPTTTTTSTTVPDTTTTTSSSLPGSTIVTTTTSTSTSTTSTTTIPPTPIAGAQLLIVDDADATKRKIVFVSKDGRIGPTAFDPSADGAFLHVFNDATGDDDVCLPLPAQRWSARSKHGKTTLKYADPQSSAGPCKTVVAKDGKLTLTCVAKTTPIDYSLDEASQTRVAVRFTSGDTTYCAVFGGTVTKDKSGKKFVAKDAPAPATCPAPPSSCD